MFETAELGQRISRREFQKIEPELRLRLLDAQQALRKSRVPVIILVAGVEGAGKGQVADCLNKWFDSRGLLTTAFWEETDEQRRRPRFWRFWRKLPARGFIGLMFGSWYTSPLVDHALGEISAEALEHELNAINAFEKMLVDDGAVIVKFWFHLPLDEVKRQLREDQEILDRKLRTAPLSKRFASLYKRFIATGDVVLRMSNKPHACWHVVEATDKHYREITVGRQVLAAMEEKLATVDQQQQADQAHQILVANMDVIAQAARATPDRTRSRRPKPRAQRDESAGPQLASERVLKLGRPLGLLIVGLMLAMIIRPLMLPLLVGTVAGVIYLLGKQTQRDGDEP